MDDSTVDLRSEGTELQDHTCTAVVEDMVACTSDSEWDELA